MKVQAGLMQLTTAFSGGLLCDTSRSTEIRIFSSTQRYWLLKDTQTHLFYWSTGLQASRLWQFTVTRVAIQYKQKRHLLQDNQSWYGAVITQNCSSCSSNRHARWPCLMSYSAISPSVFPSYKWTQELNRTPLQTYLSQNDVWRFLWGNKSRIFTITNERGHTNTNNSVP